MTRFRALAVSAALVLSFNFAGCFDWHDDDPCQAAAAAGAAC